MLIEKNSLDAFVRRGKKSDIERSEMRLEVGGPFSSGDMRCRRRPVFGHFSALIFPFYFDSGHSGWPVVNRAAGAVTAGNGA